MKTLRTMLFFSLAMVAACGAERTVESTQVPPERKAIWEEAFNRGDAKAVAALYAEDAVLVQPAMPAIVGRPAILEALEGFVQSGAKVELKTEQNLASGDLGVTHGTYRVLTADGRELDRGYFNEIWRKRAGEWYVTYDINTSSVPPPSAAPAAPAPAAGS